MSQINSFDALFNGQNGKNNTPLYSDLSNNVSKSKTQEGWYSPKASENVDQTYRAIIKFLPFFVTENGKETIQHSIQKFQYYVTPNPSAVTTNVNGILVDSYRTIGQRCPLAGIAWKFHSSSNPVEKDYSNHFQRSINNYSVIQIVKDEVHPEFNGKILKFKFGNQILKKINDAEGMGIDPFALIDSPLFILDISTRQIPGAKTALNWYENSTFTTKKPYSVKFDGKVLSDDTESQKEFFEWYRKNQPDMTDCLFKEWTPSIRTQLTTILNTYNVSLVAPSSSFEVNAQTAPSPKVQQTAINASATDDSIIDDILGEKPAPTKSETKKPKVESVDELDDIIDSL